MQTLFDYQEVGARALSGSSALYLGDQPGLGKSAQIATATDYARAERVLIGAPASLKQNWKRELEKFSIGDLPIQIINTGADKLRPGPGVTIVNYDLIIRPAIHKQIRSADWDVMAFDEAHALKTPHSTRTRAVLGSNGIVHSADKVWMASGTPAPNDPSELYAVLHAIYPKATRGMSYNDWVRYYCVTRIDDRGNLKAMGNKPTIEQLKQDMAGFMLRRKRKDVLKQLPPLLIGSISVENPDALKAIRGYTRDHPDLEALLGGGDDPDLEDELHEAEMATLRRMCGAAKAYALLDEIKSELDGGTQQIVLMCWHKDTIDILSENLAAYGVAVIDGRVPVTKRQAVVDRFNNHGYASNCRVFIGQILAAGVGHTMTNAHDMIIVEPSWVPSENVQAMLRIHRIGQLNKCLVRYARLAGSIDEAIMATAERKAAMLAELY